MRTAILTIGLGVLAVLGGAALPWVRQTYGADHSGVLGRTGFEIGSGPLTLALVAAAGTVAALAARGLFGRVIAGLVALAGAGLIALAVAVAVDPPAHAGKPGVALPAGPELMDPVAVQPWGIGLSVAGGVLVLAGGIRLALRRPAGRAGLNSRYDAPGDVPVPAAGEVDDAESATVWWRSLEAGHDPTAEPGPDPQPPADPPGEPGRAAREE